MVLSTVKLRSSRTNARQNNQIAALRKAGVIVATINSTMDREARNAVLVDLQCGHPHTKLLYVTPEYCAQDHFRRVLRIVYNQQQLSRIAVDEAHCISEWGHDFRRSFKELSFFRRELPSVPIMCLTATATSTVRSDVISTLELDTRKLKLYTMTTVRSNLHYEVRFKNDEEDHYPNFLTWLQGVHARRASRPQRANQLVASKERIDNVCGIIYTWTRSDCEILAARLRDDGIGAKAYHAGLTSSQKDDHLQGWVENRIGYDVIVATTAFGMGIDKDNVRFVVHWQLPRSFEGFYQEAGRAGRDGKGSVCIMYYSREDRDRAASMLARDNAKAPKNNKMVGRSGILTDTQLNRARSLQALIGYCEDVGHCRHQLICDYFGEDTCAPCEWACDWHKDAGTLVRAKDGGLASEEWCTTQRQMGAYEVEYY